MPLQRNYFLLCLLCDTCLSSAIVQLYSKFLRTWWLPGDRLADIFCSSNLPKLAAAAAKFEQLGAVVLTNLLEHPQLEALRAEIDEAYNAVDEARGPCKFSRTR